MRRGKGSESFNYSAPDGYPRFKAEQDYDFPGTDLTTITADQLPDNRRGRRLAAKLAAIQREPSVLPRVEIEPSERELTHETPLGNPELPVYDYRQEIVDSVRDNQVTIIVSETGSGKSTQVPQFIADELGVQVALTQPRRLAARNIASRVQEEISQVRPEMGEVVGYHTAERNTCTENTQITVCTDGLRYVRQLHDDGSLADEVLIIDEVHEWNTNIEMLVAWTYRLIEEHPNMRLVIMSATVDAGKIAEYYSEVAETFPNTIEVPGRTFPVDKREATSSTVVEELTRDDMVGKNVLCFLPGVGEIRDLKDKVREMLVSRGVKDMPELIGLHSKMSEAEQGKAFESYPHGKIVFATDVAQTSITIPDIDAVVDSGLVRQKEANEENVDKLAITEISQADCDQRAGRAGRVKPGLYVLTRLNEDVDHVSYISREKFPTPEIMRTSDHTKNVLNLADVGLHLNELKLLHPVRGEAISYSAAVLESLGALDEDGNITAMGRRMNKLPIHPEYARMVMESEQHSDEVRAQVIAMAAACDVGGLKFHTPWSEKRWKSLTEETQADHLAQLDIILQAMEFSTREQQEHDLDVKNVDRAIEQYGRIMRRSSLDENILTYPNDRNKEAIKECILAGKRNKVYRHIGSGDYMLLGGAYKTKRELSNRSEVKGRPEFVAGEPWVAEFYKSGEKREKHVIEMAMAVSIEQLSRIALNLCRKELREYKLRKGRVMGSFALRLHDVTLAVQEQPASPDAGAQQFIRQHIKANPGPALRRLYHEISDTKQRQLNGDATEYTPDSLRQSAEYIVNEAIEQAAAADNLEESYIDNKIRELTAEYLHIYE